LKREAFLKEVQYQADAPDAFSRLDRQAPTRLREWFLKHPWVESVDRVEVRPGEVEVKLTFREPVLAVRGPERLHAVSRDGLLLPRAAQTDGLPVLRGEVSRPAGTGKPWGSPAVTAAARTASLLRSGQARLDVASMEFVQGELVLWTRSGCRVVWGRPTGEEKEHEPAADLKRERLLESLEAVGQSPLPVEIDLRPRSGASRRVLIADNGDSGAR
jgi:hypothetical protein